MQSVDIHVFVCTQYVSATLMFHWMRVHFRKALLRVCSMLRRSPTPTSCVQATFQSAAQSQDYEILQSLQNQVRLQPLKTSDLLTSGPAPHIKTHYL